MKKRTKSQVRPGSSWPGSEMLSDRRRQTNSRTEVALLSFMGRVSHAFVGHAARVPRPDGHASRVPYESTSRRLLGHRHRRAGLAGDARRQLRFVALEVEAQ